MEYAQISIAGNLGADPKMRAKADGELQAVIPLGVRPFLGGNDRPTDWYDLVFKGRQAETAEKLLKKGANIFVVGVPYFAHWEDRDGNKRKALRVLVREWRFCESQNATAAKAAVADAAPFPPGFDEDIKF